MRLLSLVLCLGLAWIPQPLGAEVRLASLFTDGMVLQQGRPVQVWGAASEGESVSVTFRGKTVRTTAQGGTWKVSLPRSRAGGPFEMVVRGENQITLTNVLVGEVWVCSGQSNMEWDMSRSYQPQADIDAAQNPRIRLFTVPKRKAEAPADSIASRWVACTPETVRSFSAVAYYFGRSLEQELKVPIGLIHVSWGGSPAEAWMSPETLKKAGYHPDLEKLYAANWSRYEQNLARFREREQSARQAGQRFTERAPNPPWRLSELYHGMLAPVIPYTIRGVIWYQGESNAGRAWEYRQLFQDLIQDWRAHWGLGDFPFLAVQLAPFDNNRKRSVQEAMRAPEDSTWAELREAQNLAARQLPNVGVAVITDAGDKDDIHPARKKPVGERLALLARRIAYGQRLVHTGPTLKSFAVRGNTVLLTFDHVGSGLIARGGDLTGFAVAGEDRKFHWATARIVGKNRVEVVSGEVLHPKAVRFGWADFPVVNLFNREGLPASPFRTDDFPLTTQRSFP